MINDKNIMNIINIILIVANTVLLTIGDVKSLYTPKNEYDKT